MSKWKHKPTIVDAYRWTGGPDQLEDPEWIVDAIKSRLVCFDPQRLCLADGQCAVPGDYIIMDADGKIYVCEGKKFAKLYELAEVEVPDGC